MVQCSTASSTNHCICNKTCRNWLTLHYCTYLEKPIPNFKSCYRTIYWAHFLVICKWLYFAWGCNMVKSMMLKSAGWRDGGKIFIILVNLSCCKIYDEYKGVSKAKQEDSALLKWSLNIHKLYENMSFELHTAGHNTRYENIILNETSIA